MKNKALQITLVGLLTFSAFTFSLETKTTNIQNSNVFIANASAKRTEKLSTERVKQIILARVPGSVLADIIKFSDENDFYKGIIKHNNSEFSFVIDAYTGRFIEWKNN